MYMAENFDLYMSTRLADVALGRREARKVAKSLGKLSPEAIIDAVDNKFSVKSASIPGKM